MEKIVDYCGQHGAAKQNVSLATKKGEHNWIDGHIVLTIQNTKGGVPHDDVLSKHFSISLGMNKKECLQLLNHYTKDEKC